MQAEEILVASLTRHFPDSAIVAEEGDRVSGSDGTWYVDPLDGTGAFLDGLAHWGPTVSWVDDDGARLGASWFPLTGELFYAERDGGAWRNETQLRPEPLDEVRRNDCLMVPSSFHRLPALAWPGKVRALGSTAAHLALVAAGGPVACAVGDGWRMWDVAAGALMVQEAGRQLVDSSGSVYHPVRDHGRGFLAGDPTALATLLPLLQRARRDG